MDQIWPITTAMMLANFWTILFIYGLYRARNIYEGDRLDFATASALLVPLLTLIVGLYLYA